jgi:hypothetical protein
MRFIELSGVTDGPTRSFQRPDGVELDPLSWQAGNALPPVVALHWGFGVRQRLITASAPHAMAWRCRRASHPAVGDHVT